MDYFKKLYDIMVKVEVSGKESNILPFEDAIFEVVNLIIHRNREKENKVIFIGNGGSASIASHMYIDFLRNALVPAVTFNDPGLITCMSNDFGYEQVFQKPVEMIAKNNDILFSISSSGKSKNILNAAKQARSKGCFLITLSGFGAGNPLRKLGDINFYVPSASYGAVEIAHSAIGHYIVDSLVEINRNG